MLKKLLFSTVFVWINKILANFVKIFFYKVVVPVYKNYLSLINRIGWSKIRGNFINFIFGQKLVHVVVVIITASFVFTNLVQGTRADELITADNKPIISKIVGSEFGSIEQDLLFEEALSPEELNLGLTQNYLSNKDVLESDLRVDETINNETELVLDSNQDDSISDTPQVAVESNTPKRKETIEYIVESGDTISTIARKFNISVNTVLWENDLNSYSVIRPGDELSILPESGLSHTVKSGDTLGAIANSNDVEIKDILEANNMTVSSKLSIGQKLFIPGGSKIVSVAAVNKSARSYTGIEVIKDIVKPIAQKTTANKMAWPTIGNTITQYFSWRHTGLDIANRIGTPLFAADTGTVEYASWSNGYGNNVVINHGGGKKTRYAHMSKFYVSKGDSVTKGEAIGEMGSTGWSTGPHVHFEVMIDGVKYNPLNYIR